MNANNNNINNNVNRYTNKDNNNIDVIINNNNDNINNTSNNNDVTATTANVGLRCQYNNKSPALTTNAATLESSLLSSLLV